MTPKGNISSRMSPILCHPRVTSVQGCHAFYVTQGWNLFKDVTHSMSSKCDICSRMSPILCHPGVTSAQVCHPFCVPEGDICSRISPILCPQGWHLLKDVTQSVSPRVTSVQGYHPFFVIKGDIFCSRLSPNLCSQGWHLFFKAVAHSMSPKGDIFCSRMLPNLGHPRVTSSDREPGFGIQRVSWVPEISCWDETLWKEYLLGFVWLFCSPWDFADSAVYLRYQIYIQFALQCPI